MHRDFDIKLIVLGGVLAAVCLIWFVSPWFRLGGIPDQGVIYFDMTIRERAPPPPPESAPAPADVTPPAP